MPSGLKATESDVAELAIPSTRFGIRPDLDEISALKIPLLVPLLVSDFQTATFHMRNV